MKNRLFLLPLILIACMPQDPPEEQWIPLFNGQDLTGWTVKVSGYDIGVNAHHTFRVEDGLLKVTYAAYDQWNGEFAHLFYHQPYSHYRLRMEYRLVGQQLAGAPAWAWLNSGVMLHAQAPDRMEKNQDFPVALEMQFLGSTDSLTRPTGNLASPGTHVVVADSLYTEHMYYSGTEGYLPDEWVSIEAIVWGDSIIHYVVAGDTVLTFMQPQIGGWENEPGWMEDKTWISAMKGTPLKAGYIALQAESHPVHFRNIELLDLSKE